MYVVKKTLRIFIAGTLFLLILFASTSYLFYSELKNKLEAHIPYELKKEISFSSISYDAYKNLFTIEDLKIEDKEKNVSIKVPYLSCYFFWYDFLLDRSKIKLSYLEIEKPEIKILKIKKLKSWNTKWKAIKKVFISSGKISKNQKWKNKVLKKIVSFSIYHTAISHGNLELIDHLPGKKKKKFSHKFEDISFSAKNLYLLKENFQNVSLTAKLYKGAMLKITSTANKQKGKLKILIDPGLKLHHYNSYINSNGFYLQSGTMYINSSLSWEKKYLHYKNKIIIMGLSVKKNTSSAFSFFENIVANPLMEMMKDANGNITIKTKGKISLKKGSKYAVKKMISKSKKAVKKKLSF